MMKRVALFPGSFDPFHNGHQEVLDGALRIFDEVVIAAFDSTKQNQLFKRVDRERLLKESVSAMDNVTVTSFDGLVANIANELGACALVRGLRAVSDFENELQTAQMNRHLSGIDTVFIPTTSSTSFLSSRLIREVAQFGGDISALVPPPVAEELRARFNRSELNKC